MTKSKESPVRSSVWAAALEAHAQRSTAVEAFIARQQRH
eukprot:CAMPEP_0168395652 /NCGR_PEP_ID=MMETSP0228-20121227/20155_1 /TAXON_ID=133427 /ORGANISM="Protoceratium reticulatum, Strain CCCM 535 (=CCMP 1889)" /LENGTH=38 /DNA_ID= /DNA_START= /DNA_END= /DNA_ORIENTATION=